MDIETNRVIKWSATFILGLIAVSFVYFGTFDVLRMSLGQKKIAQIDGQNLNTQAFFQMFKNQLDLIKKANPKITKEQLKAMQLPERILQQFVSDELFTRELKQQGFMVSDAYLEDFFKKDAETLALYLKHYAISKTALIEDARKRALAGQMNLFYHFPVVYKQTLTQGLSLKRTFDCVEIPFEHLAVSGAPTQDELKDIEKGHGDKLVIREQRTVSALIFDAKLMKIDGKEVASYAKTKGISSKEALAALQDEKNKKNINDIRAWLEKEEVKLPAIAQKYGYKVVTLTDLERDKDLPNLPKNLTQEAFELQKGETSDLLFDDTSKAVFLLTLSDVKPQRSLEGKALNDKLTALWKAQKQKEAAQKIVEKALDIKDEKGFMTFCKANKLTVKKMALSTQPLKLPADFTHRILTAQLGRVVFTQEETRTFIGFTLSDDKVQLAKEAQEKSMQEIEKGAFSSLDNAFYHLLYRRHTVKMHPELMDSYL